MFDTSLHIRFFGPIFLGGRLLHATHGSEQSYVFRDISSDGYGVLPRGSALCRRVCSNVPAQSHGGDALHRFLSDQFYQGISASLAFDFSPLSCVFLSFLKVIQFLKRTPGSRGFSERLFFKNNQTKRNN